MTPEEFRQELRLLGLIETSDGTELVQVWELGELDFYLPRPETILEHDRREALFIIKKTLGIGVRQGVH